MTYRQGIAIDINFKNWIICPILVRSKIMIFLRKPVHRSETPDHGVIEPGAIIVSLTTVFLVLVAVFSRQLSGHVKELFAP